MLVSKGRSARTGRVRSRFTDAELWVTPDDYATVTEAIDRASTTLHGAARPPRSEGTIKVAFSAALFEMEAGPAPDAP